LKQKRLESRDWRVGENEQSLISDLQSPINGCLLSVSIPAPGVDTTVFLQQALGQPRFFWSEANGGLTLAGFGIAADLSAWGTDRFSQIQAQAQALFADAVIDDEERPLPGPRLFGGFSFIDDFTPDNTWSIHYPAQFILPHYQLAQHNGESWLTLNAILPPDEAPESLLPELQAALRTRLTLLQNPVKGHPFTPAPLHPFISIIPCPTTTGQR
jgi:menaquinone-specific isochorismate synthase